VGLFRFKQFSVNDDRCTMKVGTDAVLLGAWCNVHDAMRILDIGTGSGVIALMLAQRSDVETLIDAVEINADDAAQARDNVSQSPWPKRVRVIHGSIQDMIADSYDLIVCNPPYFSKSLLPPDESRTRARHSTMLSHDDLIAAVRRLLKPAGKFYLILPTKEAELFREEAEQAGLYLQELTRFHSRKEKPQERSLMTLGYEEIVIKGDTLVLYEDGHTQSMAYQKLTGEFYL
jgi:tRNA1Val (adenine37-N6)-methyltransferase